MTSHRFGYLLFGIITMLTLYGCESKENSKSPTFNSKYYSFDTDMINLQMKEGDRGKIFQKIEENGVLKDQQYSVLLSSEEYWQILSVFMEEIEGEQLSNWSVDEIAYFGKCSEVYQGFGSINIWIFKQKRNLLYVDIIKKSIEIVPGYGYLEYFDEKSQKFPLGLKYIKLESINISPEDALKDYATNFL